jgi:hypothetical protein
MIYGLLSLVLSCAEYGNFEKDWRRDALSALYLPLSEMGCVEPFFIVRSVKM